MPEVVLKPGRERSLVERHPWVFSGAIATVAGAPEPGETVEVRSSSGELLARGSWSPASQISVRVLTFDPAEEVSSDLLRRRVARAVAARGTRATAAGAACRLVHAEADGLPGVVVDRYADWLVLQATSAGAERWRTSIVEALAGLVPCAGIYERSDTSARLKEGLEPRVGVLFGREPPELVEIREGAACLLVDLRHGHKTGFYLDQHDNRGTVAAHGPYGEVLDCFSYTGAFTVAALLGGASAVVAVESSAPAAELARRNLERNGFDLARVEQVCGSVFEVLRGWRDRGRSFDCVILDPPRFAESKQSVERATRGYKDVNLLALKLLRPGGTLFTFSCSGHVDAWLFEKVVAGAALDAGREVQVLRRLGAGPDHPGRLSFPEGTYLKGLWCRV